METATQPKLELIQVADVVAREKGIEREEVLEAMEQAIQKAGRSKYGHDHDIRAHIDRQSGAIQLARFTEVIESLGNHGLRAVPSKANFLLVLFEGELKAVTALDAIAEEGYAVRHIPVPGLSDALRITIGKTEDMAAIADVLRKLAGATA